MPENIEQVVIIGAGISGLTAAVYTARADLKPKVVTGMEAGGQLMLTTEVENFPGFPEGIKGPDLIANTKKQAAKFGAEFIMKDVVSVDKESDSFIIDLGDEKIKTSSLIIATGASARMLGLESESRYVGRGVSTCATCDAAFFKDKVVSVIGGGDSACEEALTLAKFASKVYLIHRRDELRASKIMQDRVLNHEKIELIWDSVVEEVLGDGIKVTGLKLKNTKTGAVNELKLDGMFLGIGHFPNTKFLGDLIELDEAGYIKTPGNAKTNVEGIFVAGDVADPVWQQAITAAGSGCIAALQAGKYLEEKM